MSKLSSPAAERNRAPLLEVLREILPASGEVLEISSGSGQHAVWFAAAHPGLRWQPSDLDPGAVASIRAWADEAGLPNLAPPIILDVCAAEWGVARADVIVNANMIHIAPWEACVGLLAGAGRLLPPGGVLFMYGPYLIRDRETAPSNLAFDQSLKARDPRWGLRWLHEVAALAASHGLVLERVIDMPANNVSVVYRKEAGET